ncbi:MAG: hypothetical protein DDT21_01862 [Syntrophomonadaceae bacterium]|nr:hypothetical protein [Bacillota bacterium]
MTTQQELAIAEAEFYVASDAVSAAYDEYMQVSAAYDAARLAYDEAGYRHNAAYENVANHKENRQ